jgi:hypothetical protein
MILLILKIFKYPEPMSPAGRMSPAGWMTPCIMHRCVIYPVEPPPPVLPILHFGSLPRRARPLPPVLPITHGTDSGEADQTHGYKGSKYLVGLTNMPSSFLYYK